ncbi:hypothetical protein [Geothermobacter hydrogeniphilus]|nr:hypothetical protein [Geothermobacter hydrogeniphilus]
MLIRLLVVVIGLVWASLLLVSWGGNPSVPESSIQTTTLENRG